MKQKVNPDLVIKSQPIGVKQNGETTEDPKPKKRKLIEASYPNKVECDHCDFVIKNDNPDKLPDIEKYINKECPICQNNLLTLQDYNEWMSLNKTILWANKWFSWLTYIFPNDRQKMSVKVHEGTKIKSI